MFGLRRFGRYCTNPLFLRCNFRRSSSILHPSWEYSKWEGIKLPGVSISLEMRDPTTVHGRLKRLLNKNKLSKEEWEIEKNRINDTIGEIIESIPSSLYNEDEKEWQFSLQFHDEFVRVIKKTGARVGPIPKCLEHIFGIRMFLTKLNPEKNYLVRHLSSTLQDIPKKLDDALFPFQKDGVQFAIKQGGRCLIGFV